jgi:predicted metal-dependent phosphoesterase TrpH
MKMYKTDLHVHTCLSACASLKCRLRIIARRARKDGIHLLEICDHTSCENVPGVRRSVAYKLDDIGSSFTRFFIEDVKPREA